MTVTDLETPSVTIDLDVMEANIRRVQARLDALGIANRPHVKTHKSVALARLQPDAARASSPAASGATPVRRLPGSTSTSTSRRCAMGPAAAASWRAPVSESIPMASRSLGRPSSRRRRAALVPAAHSG